MCAKIVNWNGDKEKKTHFANICVFVYFSCQIFHFTNSWRIDCKIECDNFHFTFILNDNCVYDDGGGGVDSPFLSLSLYVCLFICDAIIAIMVWWSSTVSCSCNSFTLQSTVFNVWCAKRIPKHSFSWFIITCTQVKTNEEKKLKYTHAGKKDKFKFSNHRYFTHSTICQTKMFNICNEFECMFLCCRYAPTLTCHMHIDGIFRTWNAISPNYTPYLSWWMQLQYF